MLMHTHYTIMASRFSLLFLCTLLATTAALAFAEGGSDDDILIRQVVGDGDLLNADHQFTVFKKRFGKAYASDEEHDYRFSVFKANMRRAKRHQQLDPSAVHGVTQFSDLTPTEFRRKFLGLNRRLRFPSDAKTAPILPTDDLPSDFDWRDHGAVTPVKNQVRIHVYIYNSLLSIFRFRMLGNRHFCVAINIRIIFKLGWELKIRGHAGRAGRSVPLEHWRVPIFWPQGSSSALASNSLWIVIMRYPFYL